MAKAKPQRQRSQLVISLGMGLTGAENRAKIEKAASVANKTLSAWSRAVLAAAAGMPGEELVTRAEFAELERRVAALERRNPLQTVTINGQPMTRAPNCSGCMFPHALCGPCQRWNGRAG